jgi:hypothetical protein
VVDCAFSFHLLIPFFFLVRFHYMLDYLQVPYTDITITPKDKSKL